MKIIIDLKTDNAAFENYENKKELETLRKHNDDHILQSELKDSIKEFDYQLGKILDKVKISIIENHLLERNLFDFNGNKIGNFKINYNESK